MTVVASPAGWDLSTGLRDRTFLSEILEYGLDATGGPVGVLCIGLDRSVGGEEETVLRDLVKQVKRLLGPEALLLRYGGETLLAFLPGATRIPACALGEALVKKILFMMPDGPLGISVGAAAIPGDSADLETAIRDAYSAMEVSRRAGGGRCTPANPDPLLGIQMAQRRHLLRPRYIGREQEIELILETVQDSLRGSPRVVFVRGGEGMGKTRFLEEAAAAAQSAGARAAFASLNESYAALPYYVVGEVLRELHRREPRVGRRLVALLSAECQYALRQRFGWLFPEAAVRTAPLFIEGPALRKHLFLAVVQLLWHWSRFKGLVIGIDNLLGMDRGSLAALEWLLPCRSFCCTLLLEVSDEVQKLVRNPKHPLSLFIVEPRIRTLQWLLDQTALSDRQIELLLDHNFLSIQPKAPLIESGRKKHEGNPGKFVEWLRLLVDIGNLRPVPGRWEYVPMNPEEGGFLRPSILRDPMNLQFFEVACVAGHVFDVRVAAAALGISPVRAMDYADVWVDFGVLRWVDAGQRLAFVSRSALRRGLEYLPEERRREIDVALARVYPISGREGDLPGIFHAARGGKLTAEEAERKTRELEEKWFRPDEIEQMKNLKHGEALTRIPEAKMPLDEAAGRAARQVLHTLSSTVRMIRFYPPGNPLIEQSLETFSDVVTQALELCGRFTFVVESEGFSINYQDTEPVTGESPEAFVHEIMREKLIRSVTFTRGIPPSQSRKVAEIIGEKTDPFEIITREDYWESRFDHAEITSAGIVTVNYTSKGGEVASTSGLREVAKEVQEFLHLFNSAVVASKFYPPTSAVIRDAVMQAARHLAAINGKWSGLTLGNVQGSLVINGIHADEGKFGPVVPKVAQLLVDKDVSDVSFTGDVKPGDLAIASRILGTDAWKGEETIQRELMHQGVTSIAVGKSAYQHKEVGQLVAAKPSEVTELSEEQQTDQAALILADAIRPAGPVGEAMAWCESEDEFLLHPDTIANLSRLLDAVFSARRADVACRLIRRYAQILDACRPDLRRNAAKAAAEILIHAGPKTRKFGFPALRKPAVNFLADEEHLPDAQDVVALARVFLLNAIAERDWEYLNAYVKVLADYKTSTGMTIASQVFDQLDVEGALEAVYRAISDPVLRNYLLQVLKALGPRTVRRIVSFLPESEDRDARIAGAMLLRELNPDSWRDLARHLTPTVPPKQFDNILEALEVIMESLEPAGTIIAKLAQHPDAGVFNRVHALAGSLGRRAAMEIVALTVARAEEPYVLKALETATKLALPEAGRLVEKYLAEEPSPEILAASLRFLRAVPLPELESRVIRIVHKGTGLMRLFGAKAYPENLRVQAVLALGAYRTETAHAALERAMKDKNVAVKAAARAAMEESRRLPPAG